MSKKGIFCTDAANKNVVIKIQSLIESVSPVIDEFINKWDFQ